MQDLLILYYEKDVAGRNIVKILRENFNDLWIEGSRGEILYMEEWSFDEPSVCIVASRHKSESRMPSLTVHSPGNFGKAKAGGSNRELSIAPALYLTDALEYLRENFSNLGYEISFEVTHHGPTAFDFPIMFIEVGSSGEQWKDIKACKAVAETIGKLTENKPDKLPVAIGFGGGHYCRKFSRVKDYALGHICPKYNLPNFDEEMIQKMISRTFPRPEFALVEKKGLGKEKRRILNLLSKTELELIYI